jgi:hypothetical protein
MGCACQGKVNNPPTNKCPSCVEAGYMHIPPERHGCTFGKCT